ncbi:MAG: chemotaxis protein CheW [Rhodospirillales bacterium]|nr:chemotaxis protein CheW [Rhodospirillales bacterium]
MDDLLREFLTETSESLAVLDAELVQFEHQPDDTATLGNIFRLVHTIKGTCGFIGLPRLESIAHAGENVLGKFRDGVLPVTPKAVTAILKCIDAIRALLATLEETGAEPAGNDSVLLAELNDIASGGTGSVEPEPSASKAAPALAEAVIPASALPAGEAASPTLAASVIGDTGATLAGELTAEDECADAVKPPVPSNPPAPSSAPVVEAAVGESAGTTVTATKAVPVAQQSIRVSVETLESLMNLVSELVLTRNQLLQMVRGQSDTGFSVPLQRLSHITSELQEGVMKTRMQPIGNAWSKLPRIVRDLAHETGKKLELQMHGETTELDRQVLELVKDPFTHMVRNAADHGIETPEERRKAGKPETGVIRFSAHHEGGHIIIEVSDDGRGLNLERIRAKALEKGLVREADLAQMSDQQIYQFVFQAGFSTADKVTSVSGRGVGMDVLRTNIEKIGGNIELTSTPGKGSTIIVKIPLTLAIVSALIVAAGGQRFALPQICVVELVRVNGSGETRIETIRQTPLLRLRDRLLPLIDLRVLLNIKNGTAESVPSMGEISDACVVVTQVGQLRFGVIVDEVFDTEEIVVKPVNPLLRGIRYYAGNTILGDGGVVMILDPNGIAQAIGQQSSQTEDATSEAEHDDGAKSRLLVFRAGGEGMKAIPLELVARLEEIDLATVERPQDRPMIQYRGHLMPLVACDPNFAWPREGRRPVLVFTDRGRSMGLIVEEIVDIAEERLVIELAAQREASVGSIVVNGRATELVDAAHYLTQALPGWFENNLAHLSEVKQSPRVLLVEDSPFFQRLLTPFLESLGYTVTTADDAQHALALRDRGVKFEAIISDIEMPGMDGFEFAETVRREGNWCEMPLLALSSHASERDLARGRTAGFTDYIAKFDREGLVSSLQKTLRTAHA